MPQFFPMIVTLTMNPALDKSTFFDKLVPEKKLRCGKMVLEPGGGGVNVSKAIHKLGGSSTAVFTSGGINGKLIENLLSDLHIAIRPVPIKGESRENFSAAESSTNAQYRFVMPGPALAQAEVEDCLRVIREMEPRPTIVVASGSLPEGVPDDFFAQLAGFCIQQGVKLIVDTSGLPLKKALEQGVFLAKPNLAELSSLVGADSLELSEVDDAALQFINAGHCEVMVVSLGAAGALLVTKDWVEQIVPPPVRKLSTIGAGDSMVAGMAWKLDAGSSYSDMCRFGVACGTAATMNPGTQLFNVDDVNRLYEWIRKKG
jgi:6-phosphofructokinase 2